MWAHLYRTFLKYQNLHMKKMQSLWQFLQLFSFFLSLRLTGIAEPQAVHNGFMAWTIKSAFISILQSTAIVNIVGLTHTLQP